MTRQQVGWYDGSRVHQMYERPVGIEPDKLPRHLAHTAGWVAVEVREPEWHPIATAPEGELLAVFWLEAEDTEHPERYSFDFLEEGVFQNYFNEHEHYLIAGAARGRSEDAPFTHWRRLGKPAPVAAPLPPSLQAQAQAVDQGENA